VYVYADLHEGVPNGVFMDDLEPWSLDRASIPRAACVSFLSGAATRHYQPGFHSVVRVKLVRVATDESATFARVWGLPAAAAEGGREMRIMLGFGKWCC
jgi:hypothetical protein